MADESTKSCKSSNKRQSKKRVAAWVYNTIIALLLVIALVFVFNRINNRVTFIFGKATLIIASGSMEPTIPAGSCILIEKADPTEIIVGDVITFFSDDPAIAGSLNTHRVTDIIENSEGLEFRTKGDNNMIEDSTTAKGEKLVGRFVRILPVMTAITGLLSGKYGLFIIIAVFALYVIYLALSGISTRKNSKAEEMERRVKEEVERLSRHDSSRISGDGDDSNDKQ